MKRILFDTSREKLGRFLFQEVNKSSVDGSSDSKEKLSVSQMEEMKSEHEDKLLEKEKLYTDIKVMEDEGTELAVYIAHKAQLDFLLKEKTSLEKNLERLPQIRGRINTEIEGTRSYFETEIRITKERIAESKAWIENPNHDITDVAEGLVTNKDFVDITDHNKKMRNDAMDDFASANAKLAEINLLGKEENPDSEQIQNLFDSLRGDLKGEIFDQSDFFLGKLRTFKKKYLQKEDTEQKSFQDMFDILSDEDSSAEKKEGETKKAFQLTQEHLRYAGGIDWESGKKVFLPIRFSDEITREEINITVEGKDKKRGVQKMTLYAELPDLLPNRALTIDDLQFYTVENAFTREEDEDPADNHFLATHFEGKYKTALKAVEASLVRWNKTRGALTDQEKEALDLVRDLHDVHEVFEAYKTADAVIDKIAQIKQLKIEIEKLENEIMKKQKMRKGFKGKEKVEAELRKTGVLARVKKLGGIELNETLILVEVEFKPLGGNGGLRTDALWMRDGFRYWRNASYKGETISFGIGVNEPFHLYSGEETQVFTADGGGPIPVYLRLPGDDKESLEAFIKRRKAEIDKKQSAEK